MHYPSLQYGIRYEHSIVSKWVQSASNACSKCLQRVRPSKRVISAYEEVEDALVNLDAHRKQKEELQQQVDQLTIVSVQTASQLEIGTVSQLDVFENERTLLAAQLGLLASHQQVLADTVTLYKALGGGWDRIEVANASR